MLSLEQQRIFDLYKHPRYAGEVAEANFTAAGANESCGDEVQFTARIEDGRVISIRHACRACAICTAAADLLAARLEGERIGRLLALSKDDITEELSIPLSPVRLKCALLPLETLKQTQV